MKKLSLKIALVALSASVLIASCKKENGLADAVNESSLQSGKKNGVTVSSVPVNTLIQVRNLVIGTYAVPPATSATRYYSFLDSAISTNPALANASVSFSGSFNANVTGLGNYQLGYVDSVSTATGFNNVTASTPVTYPLSNTLGWDNNPFAPTVRGWYNYTGPFSGDHHVTPVPGRTLIVSNADTDEFYKIRILSIYKDFDDSDPLDSTKVPFLSFNYVKLN